MPRPLLLLPLLSAPLLPVPASAAPPAPNTPASTSKAPASAPGAKTTFLDDEAEDAGFDVTATLRSLPVSWSLCQGEDGEAYALKLSSAGATLSLRNGGGETALASSRGALRPGALVIQRRGAMWRVLLNNRQLLEADDSTLSEGKIGYVGLVADARLQPIEEASFDDDFMRVKEDVAFNQAKGDPHQGMRIADVKPEESIWKAVAGTWATTGLSENAEAQVAQSVNAFVFKTSTAGQSLALAGRPFWNDYALEASVRPEGSKAIGLAFYAQDAKNYLLFKWQARTGMDDTTGRALLQSVVNGKVSTLTQSDGGFEDKQWYHLKVSVVGDLVRGYVDDVEVVRVRTTLFGRGQVGLWSDAPDDKATTLVDDVRAKANDKATTLFDDVRVRSDHDIHDDFSRSIPGRWQAQGEWNWNGAAQAIGASPARALTGESSWADYSVAAPVAVPGDSAAGLLLHANTDSGYLLRVGGSKSQGGFAGKAQILKMSGGKSLVLASTTVGSTLDGKASTLSFSADDGYLKATLNGVILVDAFDEQLKKGRAGLWSARSTSAPTFGAFAVHFEPARATWSKVPELYVDPKQAETMGGWSTPEGSWLPNRPVGATAATPEIKLVDANAVQDGAVINTRIRALEVRPVDAATVVAAAPAKTPAILWHKGAFWGDGRMRFKVPDLKPGQSFALLLNSSGPAQKRGGEMELVFSIKNGSLQSTLTKVGESKSTAKSFLKIEGKPTDYTMDIRQRGSFVIARAYKSEDSRKTLFAARVR